MIPRTLLVASCLSLFLSGCGGPGESATVPQAQPAEASSVTVNGYSVHFSAQSTDQLPPEVARQYNIVRSKNRAMLNVSIMRKIQEQDAVYYIGEIPVANSETLVFDITVTPDDQDEPIEVRFKRQFYTN